MKDAPYHAHIYFDASTRNVAQRLHEKLEVLCGPGGILFIGQLRDQPVGPHPKPQFEIHFLEQSLGDIVAQIRSSGLIALVHPLTLDDTADHTTLATWIGEPLTLELTCLDPPGINQGIPRFGKSDF